jgi:hypothetical protein
VNETDTNAVPRKPVAIANPDATSLVVHLHRDADHCTASFYGSLTTGTRLTFEGLGDLLAGEESVVLDFSRIDVVDNDGSEAVDALIDSIRARGAHLLCGPSVRTVRERSALIGAHTTTASAVTIREPEEHESVSEPMPNVAVACR